MRQAYIIIDTGFRQTNTIRKDQRRIVNLANRLQEQSLRAGLDLKIILVARKFIDRVHNDVDNNGYCPLQLSTDATGPGKTKRRKNIITKNRGRLSRPSKLTSIGGTYDRSTDTIQQIFAPKAP